MSSGPMMRDVIEGVGYVMYWSSRVERRLAVACEMLKKQNGGDASEVKERGLTPAITNWIGLQDELRSVDEKHSEALERFKRSLESSIELRNAVAHGLESATSEPENGKAWVETVYCGVRTCRSLDHLLDAAYTFEMAARVVDALTYIATGGANEHRAELYESVRGKMARSRRD